MFKPFKKAKRFKRAYKSDNKRKIYIAGVAVAAMLGLLWLLNAAMKVQATTDKNEYAAGDQLDVSIKNNTGRAVCFSKCYPYYLETKTNQWKDYDYGDCGQADAADVCLSGKDLKKFRLTLDSVQTGLYRLKIPVCVGCKLGDRFKTDEVLFSNPFEIK